MLRAAHREVSLNRETCLTASNVRVQQCTKSKEMPKHQQKASTRAHRLFVAAEEVACLNRGKVLPQNYLIVPSNFWCAPPNACLREGISDDDSIRGTM